jgi:hypothetical protein
MVEGEWFVALSAIGEMVDKAMTGAREKDEGRRA